MDVIQTVFTSFVSLIPVTLAQSLILAFVVLGIMIPFRTLNFPDLTSEGAFPLGGCVCGVLLAAGASPLTAIAVAIIAGFLAGCCTAFIHLRFRIHTLLAGILMMTMLYSINRRIMGKSNLSVFGAPTVFDWAPFVQPGFPVAKIIIAGLIGAIVFILLNMFFKTEKGTAIRAVGANPDMAEAQGINVWVAIIGGVGLATLMIGEAIVGKQTVLRQLAAPFVGAVVYYQLVSFCLAAGMPPPDLKLATGLFVLAMLALPSLRRSRGPAQAREIIRE